MDIGRTIMPRTRSAWRAWLARNHASAAEIWLIFHKKSSGTQTLSLNDAVEEALCFGWIDGLVKSIDAACYALRFTPRRKGSAWSESNVRRARRMITEGKMTPAGLAVLDPDLKEREPAPRVYLTQLSTDLARALRRDKKAWAAFYRLRPSQQRMYVAWIMDAKRQATRERRLAQAMDRLRQGKLLGMK
jgi:uncharacterized protein YdeI (YjbR/CyaY-like superfamily)